jgi:FMN phosphatase YigB (HAD superfamily)
MTGGDPPVACVAVDYGGTLTASRSRPDGRLVARVLRDAFGVAVPRGFGTAFDDFFHQANRLRRPGGWRGAFAGIVRSAASAAGAALPEVERIEQAVTSVLPDSPVDPAAAAAIRVLHGRGLRLVLAANTRHRLATRRETLARAGIADCFAALLLSVELGFGKPDTRFYQAVLAAAGCPPAQVLFVGDRADYDVAGPLEHGMRAALVDCTGRADRGPAGVPVLRHFSELPDLLATDGWQRER